MKKLILILLAIAPILLAQESKTVTYKEYKLVIDSTNYSKEVNTNILRISKQITQKGFENFDKYSKYLDSNTNLESLDILLEYKDQKEKCLVSRRNSLNLKTIRFHTYISGIGESHIMFVGNEIWLYFVGSEDAIKEAAKNYQIPNVEIIFREEVK